MWGAFDPCVSSLRHGQRSLEVLLATLAPEFVSRHRLSPNSSTPSVVMPYRIVNVNVEPAGLAFNPAFVAVQLSELMRQGPEALRPVRGSSWRPSVASR